MVAGSLVTFRPIAPGIQDHSRSRREPKDHFGKATLAWKHATWPQEACQIKGPKHLRMAPKATDLQTFEVHAMFPKLRFLERSLEFWGWGKVGSQSRTPCRARLLPRGPRDRVDIKIPRRWGFQKPWVVGFPCLARLFGPEHGNPWEPQPRPQSILRAANPAWQPRCWH